MPSKNGNEIKSNYSWDFNEHINLILLSMFVTVVLAILCFKCCPRCKQVQQADPEILQQPKDTVNVSTITQQ